MQNVNKCQWLRFKNHPCLSTAEILNALLSSSTLTFCLPKWRFLLVSPSIKELKLRMHSPLKLVSFIWFWSNILCFTNSYVMCLFYFYPFSFSMFSALLPMFNSLLNNRFGNNPAFLYAWVDPIDINWTSACLTRHRITGFALIFKIYDEIIFPPLNCWTSLKGFNET